MASLVMNRNYFPITIFFSLLLFIPSHGLLSWCITTYNETINNPTRLIDDPYRSNILALFSDFTSSSSSKSFYNTTAGESPNKAYGLYLCRGDATSDTCRTCIASLTSSFAPTGLTGCKEGVAYLDECMLRYANYSFFSKANDKVLGVQVGKPVTNASQEYNISVVNTLQDTIVNPFTGMTESYATTLGGVLDNNGELLYTLAQCTPDINQADCRGCLMAAKSYLQANITRVAKSAWALLPSCQLRYDNVSFYGDTSAGSSPALPSVSGFLFATFGLLLFINLWLH